MFQQIVDTEVIGHEVTEEVLRMVDIYETEPVTIGCRLNVRHCHPDIPHVIDELVEPDIVLIDVFTRKHLETFKFIIQLRFSVFFGELRSRKKHFDIVPNSFCFNVVIDELVDVFGCVQGMFPGVQAQMDHDQWIKEYVPATDDTPAVPEQTAIKTLLIMSLKKQWLIIDSDIRKQSHLVRMELQMKSYSIVDACKTSHEIWISIERLQQGESLNI
ncbi:hypothetical protein Tco_0272001 [Tanacetum coccineum]